jgi:hypothetical protein
MWVKATLATLVSSISIKVGIITEAVMSHLLTWGVSAKVF